MRGTHRRTIEITCEDYLTPRGECIIGVSASKPLKEFSTEFKTLVRDTRTRILLILLSPPYMDIVKGWGHPDLTYESDKSIVIRRSSYTCSRTAMIRADKAAIDLDRRIIKLLSSDSSAILHILFIAFKPVRVQDTPMHQPRRR